MSGRHEAAIAVYQACRKHLGIDGTTMLATAEGEDARETLSIEDDG